MSVTTAFPALAFLISFLITTSVCAPPPVDPDLKPCGEAYYFPDKYTCYNGDFLCPVLDGEPTLQCGPACYLPQMYSCTDGELIYPPKPTVLGPSTSPSSAAQCSETPTALHLSDPPYENYFYSDCHGASQIVVTSPLPDSNLTIIGPRLVVAWPAGNSGVAAFFAPSNGINGSLGIEVVNGTSDQPLVGMYEPPSPSSPSRNPRVGVSALLHFNSSALLTVPILGSIRTIRDFTEGPSILVPEIQDAISFKTAGNGGAVLSRLWLDNETTTEVSFAPQTENSIVRIENQTVRLEAGTYNFTATFDYPQLTQLSAEEALNEQSQGLISQENDRTTSLSFLSYSEKLLAGAWRFLTYFGRDSMISLLLLQPVLSEGEGHAVEAVIAAVLERVNTTDSDGSVCHEETIGDYATYLHLLDNVTSTAPSCSYIMIDSDYYFAPVMENYFLNSAVGRSRMHAFLATTATLDFGNHGMTYAELALINAEKIMRTSAAFAGNGGQTQANLIHLKEGQIVGQWRDSTYGIGGGRIPYDVNTGLVPAALRSIAALSAAGFFPEHPEWSTTATEFARVWEDNTLQFFQVTVPAAQARELVTNYSSTVADGFPSHADDISSDIIYHGLSLDGNNDQALVQVMNSDDCFRHFLLNTTNQAQLTAFINQTANNIQSPFPVGLSTPVGMFIANPAYGRNAIYAANWTNSAYHGTVIWSWPMAMMGAGLQRQLQRCAASGPPEFCADPAVHANVLGAYNHLWDLIEANEPSLSTEVWSWLYRDDTFVFEALGALPPPPGQSPTESDIRQLWSLTFLAVTRDESLR